MRLIAVLLYMGGEERSSLVALSPNRQNDCANNRRSGGELVGRLPRQLVQDVIAGFELCEKRKRIPFYSAKHLRSLVVRRFEIPPNIPMFRPQSAQSLADATVVLVNKRTLAAAWKSVLIHFRYIDTDVNCELSIKVLAESHIMAARRIKSPELKFNHVGEPVG